MAVAAVASCAFLIFTFQNAFLFLMGAVLVGVPVLFMLVSALSPAEPKNDCPECGKPDLRPEVPGGEVGVVCIGCGYKNPEASTALLDPPQGDRPPTVAP